MPSSPAALEILALRPSASVTIARSSSFTRLGERRPTLGGDFPLDGGGEHVRADRPVERPGDGQVGQHVLQLPDVARPRMGCDSPGRSPSPARNVRP